MSEEEYLKRLAEQQGEITRLKKKLHQSETKVLNMFGRLFHSKDFESLAKSFIFGSEERYRAKYKKLETKVKDRIRKIYRGGCCANQVRKGDN